MTVSPNGLSLAAEFPEATREHWQSLVEGVLRKSGVQDVTGAQAEERLSTQLQDGILVRPIYTAADDDPAGGAAAAGRAPAGYPGLPPFVRGGRAQGSVQDGWEVRQHHARTDPVAGNEAVLADLENGVGALWLTVGAAGVPVTGLPDLLQNVFLDLAGVVLDAGAETGAAAEQLFRLYEARGVAKDSATGNLGADPLGLVARTGDGGRDGGTPNSVGPNGVGPMDEAVALAARCVREYPGLRALTVDATAYHDAGASTAEELGCSLATGVAYLRALTAAGLTVDQAAGQLEFRLAATADQFLTIAKLRAARRLWSRVAQVSGVSPESAGQRQHAVTSSVMMTERDPWVNILRTTVACTAAGVGGADAVTVLPFDSALGRSDAFSRRVARNTQAILLEESHLARVIDPAGGSWYVEELTDQLARAAWDWFQQIERAGGQAAALRSGLVGERIAATWAARADDLAHRREPVTGVSEFPNLAEPPVRREPAPTGPGGGLPRVRRSQAFEALRSRSDAQAAATGQRPRLFLAAIGTAAVHTPRSSFAANLFQAGGIETVLGTGADAAALAEAFRASGASAACLCSSDRLYAEQGAEVLAALRAAGAGRVLLAGSPDNPSAPPGVDGHVFTGCDAVAVLTSTLDLIGAVR